MSNYEIDSMEISKISFDSNLDQKTKNQLISKIESKMEKMENLELSGKNTGYYN
tara:strand:+ start:563 stop:724 length:162 start_codon:yes stop_codon:yes gene_type:complete